MTVSRYFSDILTRWRLRRLEPFWLGMGLIGVAVIILHVWQIAGLPRGLYVDESSIGYNAALIAAHLHDEHQQFLPVYFEAFGEYKNPLYIYTVALFFKLFGVSVWWLRFTSFIYFAIFWAGLAKLCWTVFPGKKVVLAYAVVAGGLLPWLFSLSRISFEVISQPAVVIWLLWAVYRAFEQSMETRRGMALAALGGVLTGLSVYSYSTGRLLAFLLVGVLVAFYGRRESWKRLASFGAGVAMALLPYGWFALTHSGALTARFNLLSYVADPRLSLWLKASEFLAFYGSYFSPWFLLLHGDGNPRHHTGLGGELYWAVGLLAAIGIWWGMYWIGRGRWNRYWLFVMANLLLAPVAAALTEPFHSLRSVLIAVYALLLSLYGFDWLCRLPDRRWRMLVLGGVFLALAGQAGLYMADYFGSYADRSVVAFESYDFGGELTKALAQQPAKVIVSSHGNQPYAHLEFYRRTLSPKPTVPMVVAEPVASPGVCVIYFAADQTIENPTNLAVKFQDDSGYSKLACF